MGFYFGSMKCGPVIVPPICAFIIVTFGWREIFLICAIPGILLALIWYKLVANRPEESRWVSQSELEHIRDREPVSTASEPKVYKDRCPAWLDKVIRAQKNFHTVDSIAKVFRSWNIIGSAIAFFFMSGIINTIMAWIPTYLITEKHFSTMKMGFMSSAPFIGAVLGNMIGGWLSDRVFNKRRKPLMMVSALCTVIMMYSLIYAPNNAAYLGIMLFMAGLLLNLGYSAFVVYPMGIATKETYPMAYSVVNTGGAVGAALAPLVVGMILDAYQWDMVFLFLASCSMLSLFVITTIIEPLTVSPQEASQGRDSTLKGH